LRQIGTLPPTTDPEVFGDYLLSLGVTSRAVRSDDGWAIWVHDEDQIARAREEFAVYRANPGDPRFLNASRKADAVRAEADRLDRRYRKNYREMRGRGDRVDLRGRPLTLLLVAVCVAVYLAGEVRPEWRGLLLDRLGFFSFATFVLPGETTRGLNDIHRGEVWRLITPIFLHADLIHLLFNMWLTVVAGSIIEKRRGTWTLLALVLLSAVASNVGQFLYVVFIHHELVPWVGISGVGYAMFGYLWMKGRYEPEQGMILHPSSVRIMLIWLLIGFIPGGPIRMANGAHLVGLVVGMLFGMARF
jgi:GlpG protein